MIRRCEERDFEAIWRISNDGAQAYKGVIPQDRWKEPYMSRDELRHEIRDGVEFWGFEEDGQLTGVMGIQPVRDVTLIRHAYVRTQRQHSGIGGRLSDASARAHGRSSADRNVVRRYLGDSVFGEARFPSSRARRKESADEGILDSARRADGCVGCACRS
jgi:hypothetical protein